jgi:hypothetical protein
VVDVPFGIAPLDAVATAGSCFAQHISRTLVREGFAYLVTESGPGTDGAINENYGIFPARFGNVYTTRQLLQLFQRAYGLFEPLDQVWVTESGSLIDPFRPRIQQGGFTNAVELEADRSHHLAAVRKMFEQCDVFVFTLGLTEGWISTRDGAAFPIAPGVAGATEPVEWYRAENFSIDSMAKDLVEFIDKIRKVNPDVRIILTVSPVPLIATFELRHVLVSTVYSKSALRVVAEIASKARSGVVYFPSYELITGPQAGSRFFEADLREVTPEGVGYVMDIFKRHFMRANPATEWKNSAVLSPSVAQITPQQPRQPNTKYDQDTAEWNRLAQLEKIVCDEEAIVQDLGN